MRRKLLAKGENSGRDGISGLYMQRYPPQTTWSLAIFVSFDGLRQGFRSVFGSTAVYRCIYSNEKTIACERFRKSRNGRRSQDGLYQRPKLETQTLLCPYIHYILRYTYECPPARPQILEKVARTLLVATPSMHGFFYALSFELSSSPLLAYLSSPY
jgi:hypothetical protein